MLNCNEILLVVTVSAYFNRYEDFATDFFTAFGSPGKDLDEIPTMGERDANFERRREVHLKVSTGYTYLEAYLYISVSLNVNVGNIERFSMGLQIM